jgi:hypothetical protein
MKTQSLPSRGSTETAVRTAPPISPRVLFDAFLPGLAAIACLEGGFRHRHGRPG